MAQIIGVGVIGMGWMGSAHSRAYLQAADRFHDAGVQPRLVACADEAGDRAEQACRRFGFERSTTRWEDVIADPRIQVVNIATPNYLHRAIATAAAAAGKHIFCEKPVGKSPRETADIEQVAREAGVLTFVGFNYRWSPLVQYARQLIREGKLGRLTHFRGRFLAGYASNPETPLSWRFQKEFSGSGVSGDLLSHVVDMGLFLAGPIKRVVANRETFIRSRPLPPGSTRSPQEPGRKYADVTNEDYVGALVQFSNGAQGTLEVCRPDGDSAHDGFTRIVSGPGHPFHSRFNPAAGTGLGYDDLKTIEAHQFLKVVAEKRQAEPGFAEAVRVAEVLAAIERTWETGSWHPIASI